MKKREIALALAALKRIKMTAIEDKPLRNGIIGTHLALLGERRKFEKEVADLEKVYMGSYEDERAEIGKLERAMNAEKDETKKAAIAEKINGHTELFDAFEEYRRAVVKLENEDIEVAGIPRDGFIAEIQKQDFDLGQIEAIEPILTP